MQSHIDSLVTSGRTYHDGCDYCRCASLQTVRESENLDGSRFMLQQHIKLLFREEPGNGMPNWYSPSGQQQGKWLSNDMQLTYAVRKYAKRRSFVLPCAGAPDLCVDADSDRGAAGTTTVGERIWVRSDYIFRLFSRGSLQVWSERMRQLRPSAPLLFAHSRSDANLMLRLMGALEAWGVVLVHIAVSGHAGVPGGSEGDMRELFGFNDFDRANQRLGFFSLNVGHDFPRKASPALTLAETITHMTELLEATAPPVVFVPARPAQQPPPSCKGGVSLRSGEQVACGCEASGACTASGMDSAEALASVQGVQLAAQYLDIPFVSVGD